MFVATLRGSGFPFRDEDNPCADCSGSWGATLSPDGSNSPPRELKGEDLKFEDLCRVFLCGHFVFL